LNHGADLRRRTEVRRAAAVDDPGEEQCVSMTREHRTALTYAAENSGLAVIQLLEQAGSDACHLDSQGNLDAAYLLVNRRLSPPEQRMLYRRWMDGTAHCTAVARPTFDCSKAGNLVDLATCASSRFSSLDVEIAELFAKATRNTTPEHRAQLRREQLHWVRAKSSFCTDRYEEFGELSACVSAVLSKKSSELSSPRSTVDDVQRGAGRYSTPIGSGNDIFGRP
jgi:uncharacterized protein YecT (DUF1311 family)